MRPTPIPDDEIPEGSERIVMGPPVDADLTGSVRPIEMLLDGELGDPRFSARFVLEDGDLKRLSADEPIWVTFWGHVVPFNVDLAEETT